MIEKFAGGLGEFLDLNHTSKPMILVSLMIPKFAPEPRGEHAIGTRASARFPWTPHHLFWLQLTFALHAVYRR